jgi:cell division protein FtsB
MSRMRRDAEIEKKVLDLCSNANSMKIISEASIEQAIDLIEQMNDQDFEVFAQAFTDHQPNLAAYLFVHEDEFSDDDFDLLANLALTVYLAYELQNGKSPLLSIEEVESAAMKQLDFLDAIETASEAEIESLVEQAFDGSQQPLLLDFVARELHLMESENMIEHESGGAMIYPILQLVVDLLHGAYNRSPFAIIS